MPELPFGMHSHYLQPWRDYVETVSARDFLAGIGIVLDKKDPSNQVLDLLSQSGIRAARIEISWGELDYRDETRLKDPDPIKRTLVACHARGMRPLVVLNAHHGQPVPAVQFSRVVAVEAPAGARQIDVDSADGIVVDFTGLSDLTEYWAAEAIVVKVQGTRLSLSKPLPRAIPAGAPVRLTTLKYRPFGAPDSADTQAALRGWGRYAQTIADFVTDALDTRDLRDKAFDLEIWNELSFGSKFLSLKNYYDPPPAHYNEDAIWSEIVSATATSLHRSSYHDLTVINGFASTVPWPASSDQPPIVVGLSKHPYPRLLSFPSDEQTNGRCLDAQGTSTGFVPTYKAFFPEYYATAIQTETVIRDMGPGMNDIYGKAHGRNARRIDGTTRPVPVWITEIGINPREVGIADPDVAMLLKAKATARFLLFYLNKGAKRVYLYSAFGGNAEYGLVPDAYGASPNAAASSLSLKIIQRIAKVMAEIRDPAPADKVALRFAIEPDPGSALQFTGGISPDNPPVRNIDMLALLPFRGGEGQFIVAYYFVTRDIRQAAVPENVTIEIVGTGRPVSELRAYDPFADEWRTAPIAAAGEDYVRTTIAVSDMPRLLILRC